MELEYDIFEKLPDGSPLWHAHSVGLRAATILLTNVARNTPHECFAIQLRENRVVARANIGHGTGRKPIVFQIAYDHKLSVYRADALRQHGYEVITAIGNDAAKLILTQTEPYHFFLLGESGAIEKRRDMVQWLKLKFPKVPVLAVNPLGMETPGADLNLEQAHPESGCQLARILSSVPSQLFSIPRSAGTSHIAIPTSSDGKEG